MVEVHDKITRNFHEKTRGPLQTQFFDRLGRLGCDHAPAPLAAWSNDEIDPRAAALVAKTLGIDTHNHIDVPLIAADVPGPDLDLVDELKKSGLSAICATFAVDYQRLGVPGLAYERFQNALNSLDAQIERNGMRRALNLPELIGRAYIEVSFRGIIRMVDHLAGTQPAAFPLPERWLKMR